MAIERRTQQLQFRAQPAGRHAGLVDSFDDRVPRVDAEQDVIVEQAIQRGGNGACDEVPDGSLGPSASNRYRSQRQDDRFGELLLAALASAGSNERLEYRADQEVSLGCELELDLAKAQRVASSAHHRDGVVVEFPQWHTGRIPQHQAPPGCVQLHDLTERGTARDSPQDRNCLFGHRVTLSGPDELGPVEDRSLAGCRELERPGSRSRTLSQAMTEGNRTAPQPELHRVEIGRLQLLLRPPHDGAATFGELGQFKVQVDLELDLALEGPLVGSRAHHQVPRGTIPITPGPLRRDRRLGPRGFAMVPAPATPTIRPTPLGRPLATGQRISLLRHSTGLRSW